MRTHERHIVDHIDGESKDANHLGWIELQSFSAGIGSDVSDDSGSTRTRGVPSPETMKVDKLIDMCMDRANLAQMGAGWFPAL